MINTDSVETVVNNLKEKPEKEENKDETRTTLRQILSEDLQLIQSENLLTTRTKCQKSKTLRSRFSYGLRSFRESRLLTLQSFPAVAIKWSEKRLRTRSTEDTAIDTPSKIEGIEKQHISPRVEKKKCKITKKFSLNSIRRQKIKPREDNLVTSAIADSTNNTDNQRSVIVGKNLSLSQISLVNIPSGGEETENPAPFEQVRKLQITISGRKPNCTKTHYTGSTATSISSDDYFTASSNPLSLEIPPRTSLNPRDDSNKLSITLSERDTPPRERAPARPDLVPNYISTTVASRESSPSHNSTDSKGAIRKHPHSIRLERQLSQDECFGQDLHQLMRLEVSLDRGRRFPRPAYLGHSKLPDSPLRQEKLNSIQDYVDKTFSGNNLSNQNISESIEQSEGNIENSSPSNIKFSVGKAVRGVSTPLLRQAEIDSKEFSSIESANSTGSYIWISDTARRRIRYIGQPTFYTNEEKEILEGKRMPLLGNLAGISETSFESNFSAETQMPAFGDLTMDVEEAPIMTSGTEKREHLYKILVIGELGTGKTSFIKRYVHQFFSANYRATIGVDFALKVLHWDQNTIVRLQLWDIAGQERFGNMTRVYYKEAVGAFIVFDVTRSGTFDAVSKWKEDLDSKVQLPDGGSIPCILLANKCDQEKQGIITTPDKMDEYVKENGFAGWFETSAKENINIEEAARALVNKILLNDRLITSADILDSDKFAIGGNSSQQSTNSVKKNCSC